MLQSIIETCCKPPSDLATFWIGTGIVHGVLKNRPVWHLLGGLHLCVS